MRYLSSFERFLWLLDQIEPAHFCVAAQVEGPTTTDEWKAALSALRQRHPLLATSIRTDAAGAPYFHNEPEMQIPLRVVEGNALQRMNVEIAKEIDTPFREPDAFLLRAVLLHEEQRCVVILVVHHSIGDGISLSHAVGDLLQSLSGQTLQALPTPPSHEHLLGIQDKQQNDQEKKGDRSWKIAPLDPVVLKSTAHVTTFRFTPEFVGSLREAARHEKTTVHGAIAASIVFAARKLQATQGQAVLRMGFPVSTRKMLGQDEDCVLLTAGGTLDIEHSERTGFWDLARSVKAELAPYQMMDRIIADRKEFHEMFRQVDTPEEAVEVAKQALNATFVLSNMGNLLLETQYGELRLEALCGPSMLIGAFENKHMIGAATVNGCLTLTYTTRTPIAHLLETMNSILMDACAEQIPA